MPRPNSRRRCAPTPPTGPEGSLVDRSPGSSTCQARSAISRRRGPPPRAALATWPPSDRPPLPPPITLVGYALMFFTQSLFGSCRADLLSSTPPPERQHISTP